MSNYAILKVILPNTKISRRLENRVYFINKFTGEILFKVKGFENLISIDPKKGIRKLVYFDGGREIVKEYSGYDFTYDELIEYTSEYVNETNAEEEGFLSLQHLFENLEPFKETSKTMIANTPLNLKLFQIKFLDYFYLIRDLIRYSKIFGLAKGLKEPFSF